MIALIILAIASAFGAVISVLEIDQKKWGKAGAIICIILTLGFTLWGILESNIDAENEKNILKLKAFNDSTNYTNDTMKRNQANKIQSITQHLVDSIRDLQVELLKNQVLTGYSINNIQSKTSSIVSNLGDLYVDMLKKTGDLSVLQQKLLYPLEERNLTMKLTYGFSITDPIAIKKIENYINEQEYPSDYVNNSFPYFAELDFFLQTQALNLAYYDIRGKNFDGELMHNLHIFPQMVRMKNKVSFHALSVPKGKAYGYFQDVSEDTDGYCRIKYNRINHKFQFDCNSMPLQIVPINNKYTSILDYDSAAVLLQIYALEDGGGGKVHGFYGGLESSYINFQINFSDKKHTIYYTSDRVLQYGIPTAVVNHLPFRD